MSASSRHPASLARPHDYQFGCPDGEWTGRLDYREWGKSKNLKLYFTHDAGPPHARYWFSVFWADGYRARDGHVDFKNEETGGWYKLNTQMNDRGKPVFLGASKYDLKL
jgi:hypothetical protein